MPRFRKKFPKRLLNTTTAAQVQVLNRSRADSVDMSIAGNRGGSSFGLLLGNESLALGAQGQVLARLFGEALALVVIENGLANDAPDHARPEEILAVETLHPFHELAAVEAGIDDVGKLVAGLVGHGVDGD